MKRLLTLCYKCKRLRTVIKLCSEMAASMSLFRHTNSKGLKQESTPSEQEQDANSALSDLDRGEIFFVAADIFAYSFKIQSS